METSFSKNNIKLLLLISVNLHSTKRMWWWYWGGHSCTCSIILYFFIVKIRVIVLWTSGIFISFEDRRHIVCNMCMSWWLINWWSVQKCNFSSYILLSKVEQVPLLSWLILIATHPLLFILWFLLKMLRTAMGTKVVQTYVTLVFRNFRGKIIFYC